MNKDPTWLEAAAKTLENGTELWMTAPELVRLILQSGIKSLKSEYGQAVRTLRSALNVESKKKNDPKFIRKDYNFSCYFALARMVKEDNPVILRNPAKRLVKPSKRKTKTLPKHQSLSPPLTNGLPSSPHTFTPHTPTPHTPTLHTFSTNGTPTIEINPDISHNMDKSAGLFLPSPLTSLLGAKRIMSMLNESTDSISTVRPVREVRKRRVTRDWESEDPLSSDSPTNTQSKEMLQLEMCHSVPCLSSQVECVRSLSTRSASKDPCFVQGERIISTPNIEINPDYVYKKDSDSDISQENSDTEDSSSFRLQPTPITSQLLVKRQQRRRRVCVTDDNSESELTEGSIDVEEMEECEYVPKKQRRQARMSSTQSVSSLGVEGKFPSSEMKDSVLPDRTVTKPSEQRRHISTLFLPSSPLLNENLKTLLGMEAFEKLNEAQKQKLIAHIPIVDQCNGTRVPGDCFSNSFYSSALREWSERLALGMFTSEYKARVRGEEKRKMTTKSDNSWKEQYYERHYGDKVSVIREDSPPPYYPCSSPGSNSLYLSAIVDGYFKTETSKTRVSPPPCLPPTVPEAIPSPRTISAPISSQEKTNAQKVSLKSLKIEVNKPLKSVTSQKEKKSGKRLTKLSKPKLIPAKVSIHVSPTKNLSSPLLSKIRNKAIAKKSPFKKATIAPALAHKVPSSKSPSLLTRLPAMMSYQEILHNLKAASESSTKSSKPPTSFTAPFQHTHSVFHDHFALLSREHVPVDFCYRVASLPLSLPLCYYDICVWGKAIFQEHSYAQMSTDGDPPHKSLTLSLPRSLLSSQDGVCEDSAMVFCTLCRCLYHSNCSDVLLCPTCIVHQQNP